MPGDAPAPEHLIVRGGRPLSGVIRPSGNKNAALPILCASLLTPEPVVIRNVPDITDVRKLVGYFRAIGSSVEWDHDAAVLRIAHGPASPELPDVPLPLGMRSSVMLLGPLVVRYGRARMMEHAAGCSLGIREIDPHLDMLAGFGARIESGRVLELALRERPTGFAHWPDYASVTTTEHFAMVAAIATGRSTLVNAACEPHVQDLCRMLVQMGAKLVGIGSSILRFEGVDALGGCDVTISDDHHEVLTFLALGAATGGEIRVEHGVQEHFPLMDRVLERFGAHVHHDATGSTIAAGTRLVVQQPRTANLMAKVEGAPWPYFPVDLLPPVVALAARAEGKALFWNKIYEGAFGWIPELHKFGAQALICDPHRVVVIGRDDLQPAEVDAPYIIRVIIALFMVASTVDGTSLIRHAGPIRRAHPRFVENLQSLGARVEWTR